MTESRRGYDVVEVACPSCGSAAAREGVYLSQYIDCDTGPSVTAPRHPRADYRDFSEAQAEIGDAYGRAEKTEGRRVPQRSHFREAVRQAKAAGAPVR